MAIHPATIFDVSHPLVYMFLLERVDRLLMCFEIDWWTILCVGGVKVRVDCGDLAVVRVEDGVFEQKAERGHFWDEYVAGAIELCLGGRDEDVISTKRMQM